MAREIRDVLKIYNQETLPAGSRIEGPSIHMWNIYSLFPHLRNVGIEINSDLSEKISSYLESGVKVVSRNRLKVDLKDTAQVDQYILRDGIGLEMSLHDYDNSYYNKEDNKNILTTRFGGPKYYEKGIVCDFVYRGEGGEQIISGAKQVLQKFYEFPRKTLFDGNGHRSTSWHAYPDKDIDLEAAGKFADKNLDDFIDVVENTFGKK